MLVGLILFAPLFGALFSSLFSLGKKNIIAALIPIASLSLSLLCAIIVAPSVVNGNIETINISSWIAAGAFSSSFGFMIDGVTMVMIFVVLIVSLFVFIYSIGYMEHDAGFNKFFVFLSAFVFSMLILVMSDNFLGLFIGWEGVGLCSWLLIGFWYKKSSASFAANEAFIINRIADLAMLIGIFLIFYSFGSLKYSDVFSSVGDISHSALYWISILLFIGAMGKSAQFPLHTWLADAMEGPTPVSALIHAATMVTAGVYLVIRANPIYDYNIDVGNFIACLGAFVALFAASMALVNKDLKRIIAFSTLSQLGYMFVAAGLGYYYIALFHLATHAFFKSLLFLGTGNVMHAMNDKLDITKMGALFNHLKKTAILMIIASISLSGIYPFAGFFSKDKILEVAFVSNHYFIWIVLLIAAFCTAFYSFRLLMLVFFVPKNHDEHPHESSKIMILPMIPLAILAVFAGFLEHPLGDYLEFYLPKGILNVSSFTLYMLIAIALLCAICGVLFAIFIYKKGIRFIKEDSKIYKLLINQYYIPHLYDIVIIKPYYALSKFLWKEVDIRIIDFMVDLVANITLWYGGKARFMQNGNLSSSLFLIVLGLFILLFAVLLFL